MMRTLLLAMAVCVAVWLCAIAAWRISGVVPGGLQMVLVLAVLPLVLVGGGLRVRNARRSATAAANDDVADAGALQEGPAARPLTTMPALAVPAAAVWFASADTPADALAALVQPKRPGLHPALRDRDGLPVFAAHVEQLDLYRSEDLVARHAPDGRADDETLRALALLEQVAESLFVDTTARLPAVPDAEGRVVAGMHHRQAAVPAVQVVVQALLPAAWPAALRDAALAALRERASDCGIPDAQLQVAVSAVADAGAVWAHLRRLLDAAAEMPLDGAERWHLVLVADSRIGTRAVQRLESSGQLMTARRRDGLVPAEGAAGVLLVPAGADASAGTGALLHPTVGGETSLASLRAASRVTADLLERAMRQAGLDATAIGLVLSDADQRAAAVVEAAAAATLACPDLDAASACPALGVPNGALGIVAPVGLLALAAAQVEASSQPALVLSLVDERHRLVLAAVPPAAHAVSSSFAGADAPAPAA